MTTDLFGRSESSRTNIEGLKYMACQCMFKTHLCYAIEGSTHNNVAKIRIHELAKTDRSMLQSLFDNI